MFFELLLFLFFLFGTAIAPPVRSCLVQTDIFPGTMEKTACGEGELLQLSNLANNPCPQGEDFSTSNMADLLLSRIGIFDYGRPGRNLENVHVCQTHYVELGQGWTANEKKNRPKKETRSQRGLKCNMPKDLPGIRNHRTARFANPGVFIQKTQSEALWMQQNKLVQLGTAMCQAHQVFVQHMVNQFRREAAGSAEESDSGSDQEGTSPDARMVGPYHLRPLGQQQSLAETPFQRRVWTQAGLSQQACASGASSHGTPSRSEAGSSYHPSQGSQRQLSQGGASQPLHDEEKQRCDQVKNGVRDIAAAAGIPNDQVLFTRSFSTLADSTKAKRANVALKVTNAVMSSFAPDAPSELLELVTKKRTGGGTYKKMSEKFVAFIENVAEFYYTAAPTRQSRLQSLSLLAPLMRYSELESYLPGLTRYAYKEARRYAAVSKAGFEPTQASRTKERYNKEKVEHFIAFITSPMVVSDMPFGHVTVRKSDGAKQDIPNMIRTSINQRIVEQYASFLRDADKENMALSRSTMLRILKNCKAVTRKSLLGLDYLTYNGVEGILNLVELIDEKIKPIDGDADWAKDTARVLTDLKHFFKADYKLYIQEQSEFADYSRWYALSDPASRQLMAPTPGRPASMRRCAHCVAMTNAFSQIQNKIATIAWQGDNDKLEAEFVFENAKANILEWQRHMVRTINQAQAKDDFLHNLGEHDVWVLMDWAMKFIPKKGVESQTDWYGKKGISWHISVVFARTPATNKFYHRIYVHVFDPVAQDSETVIAIIDDVIEHVKAERPGLQKVYLRSDNAGCYHSGPTVVALAKIAEKTGVKFARYDFSEPQSGKDACDRATSTIKRHLKICIDENNKCTTAAQFIQCASSHRGVKGTTFIHAGLDAPAGLRGKGEIPGITSYHNFDFTGSKIRAWNAYKIGDGTEPKVKVRTEPLPRLHPHHTSSTHGVRHSHRQAHHHDDDAETGGSTGVGRSRWSELTTKPIATTQQERPPAPREDEGWVPDETDDDDNFSQVAANERSTADDDDPDVLEGLNRKRLYQCEEEGCTKVYQSYWNWYRHVSIGKHSYRKERQSLRDFSIDKYVQRIEASQVFSGMPTIVDAIHSQQDEETARSAGEPLPMGWALKVRKDNKRFSEEQKAFLVDKFNEGARTGQKFEAGDVAKLMRRDRRFPTKDLWLTGTQIKSFWSNLAKNREKKAAAAVQTGAAASASALAPAAAVIMVVADAPDEVDLEDIVDDEYANAFSEHMDEVIQAVIDQEMHRS